MNETGQEGQYGKTSEPKKKVATDVRLKKKKKRMRPFLWYTKPALLHKLGMDVELYLRLSACSGPSPPGTKDG